MRATLIVATEALESGELTRRDLRRRYAMVYRNVYVRTGTDLTAADRARAAWLWSGRRATLTGHCAAAVLGSRWIPPDAPVEIAHSRRPAANGMIARCNAFREDEVTVVDAMRCTTVARTAYDLGRRLPEQLGVMRIDALLNATGMPPSCVDAVAAGHPGARGIRRLRKTMALVDPGAESPQETRLRLLIVRSGLPRPVTQIPVRNDHGRVVRRIDMGWPACMVGVEYDGEQHFENPDDYAADIERLEFLAARGWLIVRVSATQLRSRKPEIIERVRAARRAHGC
ncbi:endonuclease domain-containing protein [Mycolicibacterium litorale]|uniref:endonuclease domain-containing protein n=1 Tax=Mycolicibacterium litorale TaxID=758802 RepID=UPI003CFB5D3F